jgi:glutathione peroxidase
MKKLILPAMLVLAISCKPTAQAEKQDATVTTDAKVQDQKRNSIFDQNFGLKMIDGTAQELSKWKGKKILIVNTASECGYTPQYEDLQKLATAYPEKLVVLGFPANDFGGQEPGSNTEITSFCKKNYGVTFPLFEKISVKGETMHPLYKWLSTPALNGWNDKTPSWNFCKYMLDEEGKLIKFFPSRVKPMDAEITDLLK